MEKLKRLVEIDGEIVRRSNLKIYRYNRGSKVHRKQMAFHRCKKSNRWVFGGNRTGKTECGAVETVWLVRGIHPYRKNKPNVCGWVVSLSQQVQRDVAQSKILSYLPKQWIADVVMASGRKDNCASGIIDYIDVYNVFGGTSRIGFKSAEAGREKFQGTSLDFVWFDEEPPYDVYCECKMRVMDVNGILFGTMTPLKGLSWVYDEIFLNPTADSNIWYEFVEWSDNPFLPKKQIRQLSANMSASMLDARRYGRFTMDNGMVYPEFDESIHVVKPFCVPKEWYSNISIDPGLNNPLSAHWYAVDGDGVVYVIAEHYKAKRDISYHAQSIRAICSKLGWEADRYGQIEALIDSASNQTTLACASSVAQLFREQGINVNTNVNKDLFTGISRVKSLLAPLNGKPRIYIFNTCTNLIREFKTYRYGTGDKPVKTDDHCLDELRYFVCSRPQPYHPKPRPNSVIEEDKQRLLRVSKANRLLNQQWRKR